MKISSHDANRLLLPRSSATICQSSIGARQSRFVNVVGVCVPTSSPSEGLAVTGLTHHRGTVTGLGLISGCAELHAWYKSTGSCRPATVTTARLEKHQKKTPDQDSPCQPSATYRRARFWGICNAIACVPARPGEGCNIPETASRCFGDNCLFGLCAPLGKTRSVSERILRERLFCETSLTRSPGRGL